MAVTDGMAKRIKRDRGNENSRTGIKTMKVWYAIRTPAFACPLQVWPYLLGHYKWHFRRSELDQADAKTQRDYEHKLSDWMAIEAIVRQKDKETTAANIAKLSQSKEGLEIGSTAIICSR